MAEIDSISLRTSLDLDGLLDGLDAAADHVDAFLNNSAARLLEMPTASMKVNATFGSSGSDDMAKQADGMRAAFAPLGVQLKQALGAASAPIQAFASKFGAQFEQVGPVVEKLAIRIDNAMRFPAFLERVGSFRKGFLSRFQDIATEAPKQLDKVAHHQTDVSGLIVPFDTARKKIQAAITPIPSDLGYALEAATHVDHKVAFPSFLKGIEEFRSAAVNRMKKAAEDVANAKGPGSRKARWAAKAAAAGIAAVQAKVPARDLTTKATNPKTSGWVRLGQAITLAGDIEEKTQNKIASLVARDARDIDRLIGVWLGFKKVGSAISTFGSIAGATFEKLSGLKLPKFTLDTSQSQVLKGVGAAATGATGQIKGLIATAAAAAGIFSVSFTAVDFLKNGIKGASDLNETLSKTDIVLGTASPKVKAFADDMAAKFGLVKGVTLDTASSLGGLGKSLGGLRGDSLGDFTTKFTALAADLSSFQNLDLSEAADAIRTGLSGNESDKLKELGVITTEAAVKQYALAHSIGKVGRELSEQEKFMARAGLIAEGLSAANGDLERTQGGAANQSRKLWGTLENLGTSIGTVLLPAVTAGLGVLNTLASAASSAFEASKDTVSGWIDAVVDGFDFVSAVVTHFPAAFEVARLFIYEKLAQIGDYFEVLGPNAITIAKYIGDNWILLIGDAFDATITALKNLWTNFQAIGAAIGEWFSNPAGGFHVNWTPLLDGFRATAEKFPELLKPTLTDMSKEIAQAARPITDDLMQRRAKRAADKVKPADALKDSPPAAEMATTEKKSKEKDPKQFAGAAELGSSEFYTGVVRHLDGRGNGLEEVTKASRKTADNTAAMARELAGLRRDMNARPQAKPLVI